MYKYKKGSTQLARFNQVFENQINIKTISLSLVAILAIVAIVASASLVFTNADEGEAKVDASSSMLKICNATGGAVSVPATETCYWECNPLDMSCYTNWDSLGPNQFRLRVQTSMGWAVGLANCESPGLCDPGNYDIRGRRVKGVPGDSHGTCTIIYQGYWIENDGIGYHHWAVNNYNTRTTSNYQNWSGSFKTPAYGGIYLDKTSTWDWTQTNPYYSLEGCVYYIYNNLTDATNRQNASSKIVLNAEGHGVSTTNFYAEKTFYIRESNKPGEHGKGYKVNEEIGVVKIQHDTNSPIEWSGGQITKDEPVVNEALISIQKTDTQSGIEGATEGSVPSFENAIYDFEYRNSPYTNGILHWQMATDADGKVGISERYRDNKVGGDNFIEWDGKVVAPLGVYYIHELNAPEGYLVSNTDYMAIIEPSDTSPTGTITTFKNIDSGEDIEQIIDPQTGQEKVKVLEQVIRGDYKFIKVNEDDEPLAGIPFKITSKSTGEWHIVVSDKNGIVDTSTSHYLHTKNTNCNDAIYDASTGKITDESGLTSNCGTWFGIDKSTGLTVEADDGFGALPYDTYTIEEIAISLNEKFQPFDSRSFIVEFDNYKIEGEKWVNRVPKSPLPQTGDMPYGIIGLPVLAVLCYITRRWVYYRKY